MVSSLKLLTAYNVHKEKISYKQEDLPKDCHDILALVKLSINEAVELAIQTNDYDLLMLKCKTKTNWNHVLAISAREGKQDFVDFCVVNGADNFEMGLVWACYGNRMSQVKFFEKRGIKDQESLNWALAAAFQGGNKQIIDYLLLIGEQREMKSFNWDWCMGAATIENRIDLIHYAINQGATEWNWGLRNAVSRGNLELCKFFVRNGATDFPFAFLESCKKGYVDIINYILGKNEITIETINEGVSLAIKNDFLGIKNTVLFQ